MTSHCPIFLLHIHDLHPDHLKSHFHIKQKWNQKSYNIFKAIITILFFSLWYIQKYKTNIIFVCTLLLYITSSILTNCRSLGRAFYKLLKKRCQGAELSQTVFHVLHVNFYAVLEDESVRRGYPVLYVGHGLF